MIRKITSSRYMLCLLLALVAFCFVAQPLEAKKKKNKIEQKRGGEATEIPAPSPDPVSLRSVPDMAPAQLKQPQIAGFSRPAPKNTNVPFPNNVHGIDVSHYQGRIDWAEVARDPQVEYVYLKMSEGSNMIDNTYEYNHREARRHGLKVGVYHFFRANTTPEAQFQNFMSVYNKKQQDLLPVIDVELSNGVSESVFISRLERLLELITKEIGRRPIIYTGKHYYKKYMQGSKFRQYIYFIASYTTNPPILENNDDYNIWQFSCKGSVRGIRGDVDLSCLMGKHTLKEIMF